MLCMAILYMALRAKLGVLWKASESASPGGILPVLQALGNGEDCL